MKKVLSLLLAAMLMLGAYGVLAEDSEPEGLLDALRGSYVELFTTNCAPEYDEIWLERCAQYIGEENAEAAAAMLKAACVGTIYGQEAVDAYTAAPESTVFDCYFIGGVAQFHFDGNRISGTDAQGNVVFDHTYAYVTTLDMPITLHAYKTEDEDAGEFTYICLADDTPGTTYHIEFRYGSDLEALSALYEGPYAYWLAAGIRADADEEMIYNGIDLFCAENLTEEEAA